MDVEQPLRCEVTGNPSGTDTWEAGRPCGCQSCLLWRADCYQYKSSSEAHLIGQLANKVRRLRSENEALRRDADDPMDCHDCGNTGWNEDREGRSLCSCVSETDAVKDLVAQNERLVAVNAGLVEALTAGVKYAEHTVRITPFIPSCGDIHARWSAWLSGCARAALAKAQD